MEQSKVGQFITRKRKEKSIPKLYVSSIILVVIGIALSLLSMIFSGSALKDFISGFLVGIALDLILIGLFMLFFAIFTAIKKNKRL